MQTSTGIRNKIQVSESTYHLLVQGGKASWTRLRPDKIEAKGKQWCQLVHLHAVRICSNVSVICFTGKGSLQTYFVDPNAKRGTSSTCGSSESGDSTADASSGRHLQESVAALSAMPTLNKKLSEKEVRLVEWIVDLLHEHIKKLVAIRTTEETETTGPAFYKPPEGQTSLDEVAEVIRLPKFNVKNIEAVEDIRSVVISPEVMQQLKDFVSTIASMYHDNDFHNFGQ
jgi:hypothetical protein